MVADQCALVFVRAGARPARLTENLRAKLSRKSRTTVFCWEGRQGATCIPSYSQTKSRYSFIIRTENFAEPGGCWRMTRSTKLESTDNSTRLLPQGTRAVREDDSPRILAFTSPEEEDLRREKERREQVLLRLCNASNPFHARSTILYIPIPLCRHLIVNTASNSSVSR